MKTILEKVSYLKGLTDGLKINDKSEEGKVITEMIAVLQEMAEELDDIQAFHDIMDEQLEAVDEDLADLEDYVYELDYDDYDDYDDDDSDYEDDYYDDYDSLDFPVYEDEDEYEEEDTDENFTEEDRD